MCFEKEQFDPAKGPPPRKPTVNSGERSLIDSIFNAGANVFERLGAIELEKYEAERLLDIREAEEQARILRQKELAGTAEPKFMGTSTNTMQAGFGLLGAGMIGLAAILFLRGS